MVSFLLDTARVWPVQAETVENDQIKPSELYAQSAVLMDAETGRILFAKNGQDEMPMASTTKIMTCILASGGRRSVRPGRL